MKKRTYKDPMWKRSTLDGKPFPEKDHLVVRVMETGKPVYDVEYSIQRPDGMWVIVSINAAPLRDATDTIAGMVSLLTGITERKRAEEVLRESEERFRQLAENIQEVFWMTDPRKDQMLYISPGYEEIWGRTCESLYASPQSWLDAIHPEDRNRILEAALTKQVRGDYDEEYRITRPDGSIRWIRDRAFPVRDKFGEVYCIVGVAEDITRRKQDEETIRHLAYYDILTGLPNRALFNDRLALALAHAHRNQQKLAILFLDLDRFKTIVETLGHVAGDQLLRGVAERLRSCLREGDTIARPGGDEFMVLLPGVANVEEVLKIIQKILQALRSSFNFNGQELYITTSIGIALYPNDGEDTPILLKNADTALHRAKEQDLNTYQFYSQTMNATAFERLVMENSLRRALEREEFVVYYQPQVSLTTGQIVGIEALVRWQHPDLGLVAPMKFIPLAEETELIVPLGPWVLRTAYAQNKAWQEAGFPPLRLAVNLSARLFKQPNLEETVAQILRETRLDPNYLELELTD